MKIAEANKTVARKAIEEIWNQHNPDAVDALYAANYVTRDRGGSTPPDREGFKQMVRQAVAAAPDARLSIDLLLAKGDRVALRYRVHNGHGAPVTGGLHLRVVRGQIRESWGTTRMVELVHRAGNGHHP